MIRSVSTKSSNQVLGERVQLRVMRLPNVGQHGSNTAEIYMHNNNPGTLVRSIAINSSTGQAGHSGRKCVALMTACNQCHAVSTHKESWRMDRGNDICMQDRRDMSL